MYCEICGAKLKWYHKRVEFTFVGKHPVNKDESQLYTWNEAVCWACIPKDKRKQFSYKKKRWNKKDDDTSNSDYIYSS